MSDGKAPEPPQLPPPPEPFKFGSFKDLLNNVEIVQSTGPDGKEHFVQKEIAKDPVSERFVQEARNRMGVLLGDIDVLARDNPRLVAPFQGFINTVSQINDRDLQDFLGNVNPEDLTALKDRLIQTNTFLNNEQWNEFDHNMEIDLTARGMADSTVANDYRIKSQRGRALSNDQIRNQAEMVSDNLMSSDLARKGTMYEGRRAIRSREADIAGQQYQLQQGELDKQLLARDDRFNKLGGLIGLNQSIINEDLNKKRGSNIAPTVLGAQSAITGQNNSVWGQQTQNQMQQYQIASQKAASDANMWGNITSAGITGGALLLGGGFGPAALTSGLTKKVPVR